MKTSPVPLSATPCRAPVALLSPARRRPVVVPAAFGLKVTAMAQLAPPLTKLPQVLVWEKSPAVPMALITSVTVPVLVSLTVRALLLAPTGTVGKVSEEGDKLTSGPIVPVPLKVPFAGTIGGGVDCSATGSDGSGGGRTVGPVERTTSSVPVSLKVTGALYRSHGLPR